MTMVLRLGKIGQLERPENAEEVMRTPPSATLTHDDQIHALNYLAW